MMGWPPESDNEADRYSVGKVWTYARMSTRVWGFRNLSAGFELLTSLEWGWGSFSTFRIGVAWPLVQADDLDQEGPVIVFQLGRPL